MNYIDTHFSSYSKLTSEPPDTFRPSLLPSPHYSTAYSFSKLDHF